MGTLKLELELEVRSARVGGSNEVDGETTERVDLVLGATSAKIAGKEGRASGEIEIGVWGSGLDVTALATGDGVTVTDAPKAKPKKKSASKRRAAPKKK